MDGSSALVVGGATGIGRAVVERFLAEGASVTVLDVDPEPLEVLGHKWGDQLAVVEGDAVSGRTHTETVAGALRRFGRIDALVCCAGRFDFHTPIGTLTEGDLSRAFDEIFAVNVKSPLLAVHAASAELRRSRGSVVLTISGSAFHPEGGGVLYGASKWATRGIVTHLAREMAPQVRVNGVAPGGTAGTRLSGLATIGEHRSVEEVPGRMARLASGNLLGVPAVPEDHAGVYVFLASRELSPFVNAAVVNSDGGRGERLDGLRTPEDAVRPTQLPPGRGGGCSEAEQGDRSRERLR